MIFLLYRSYYCYYDKADIEEAKQDLTFVAGTEDDDAPVLFTEEQLKDFTRKMDILYRHFFAKWELIGRQRYNITCKKRLAMRLAEQEDNDAENINNGGNIRRRRVELVEASKKVYDMMASFTQKM